MKQWSRKHQTASPIAIGELLHYFVVQCLAVRITGLWAQQQRRSASASQWWEMAQEEGEQANSQSDHTHCVYHGQGLLSSTCWPCIYNGIALGCDLFREWIPISVTNSALEKHNLQHSVANSCLTDQFCYSQPYFITKGLIEMTILFLSVLHCPWKTLFTPYSSFQMLLYRKKHCVSGIIHVTIATGEGQKASQSFWKQMERWYGICYQTTAHEHFQGAASLE